MIKIGITGVPGAGKTSLARGIASTCRTIPGLKSVELVSEYARRYISKHGSIDTIWEQYRIMEKQIEWEESVSDKTEILITDSPVHLGFIYAMELVKFGDSKSVMIYNDCFKRLSKLSRYDLIFHLEPKLKPVEDGVRPQLHFDERWRTNADQRIRLVLGDLFGHDVKVIAAEEMTSRIDVCLKEIERCLRG